MDVETDEDVVGLAIAGDGRRFAVLWDRHRDRVFHHLVQMGNDRWAAEDLTATVFLELWRHRASVRYVDGSALPWLILTAQNLGRNASRSRRRYRAFLANLPEPHPIRDPAEDIVERHDARVTSVRNAIAAARPVDRQLLAMTVLEGFTVREAALVIGISTSAAKMRISRMKSRLAAVVDAAGQVEGSAP